MTSHRNLRKGTLQLNCKRGCWKGDPDFILVFNGNHTSMMHRFRYNQVLPLAGNDVIVLSPQGGAVSDYQIQILKGWPWLYIHGALTFCVYLELFRSWLTCSFGWDFSILGFLGVVFRGCHPQIVFWNSANLQKHSLAPIHVCEPVSVKIGQGV